MGDGCQGDLGEGSCSRPGGMAVAQITTYFIYLLSYSIPQTHCTGVMAVRTLGPVLSCTGDRAVTRTLPSLGSSQTCGGEMGLSSDKWPPGSSQGWDGGRRGRVVAEWLATGWEPRAVRSEGMACAEAWRQEREV